MLLPRPAPHHGGLVTLLMLAACSSDPKKADGTAVIESDGAHVKIQLLGVEQATFRGETIRDGHETRIPLAELKIGPNHFAIEGDFDNPENVYVPAKAKDLLELVCEGSQGSLRLDPEDFREEDIEASNCFDDYGRPKARLVTKNGASIEVDGELVEQGILLKDRRGQWMAEDLMATRVPMGPRPKVGELPLSVRSEGGKPWKAKLHYRLETNLFDTIARGLPESAEGLPPPDAKLSALAADRWWYLTDRKNPATVARFATIEKSKPRNLQTCRYQGGRSVAYAAEDWVVAVRDRSGEEVGRKRFPARWRGCPKSDRFSHDTAGKHMKSRIHPLPEDVLAWLGTL